MKTPTRSALLGSALLVAAVLFLAFTRHDPAPAPDESSASVEKRNSPRTPAPANTGGAAAQKDEPPLALTAEGLPDFSNYDRNGDGDPEVDAFLNVYKRVDSSAGKIDMLDNVRTFGTLDDPRLNDLLIIQAARSDDAEVRQAARSALFEYGQSEAHAALESYLKAETRVTDRAEMEKLLGDLQRPTLSQFRSTSKGTPVPPSLPKPTTEQ